jgi:asparagine synthetase B (glutamine-hydrolysing)
MCGIAGWVSFDRDLRAEQLTVDAMTETMSCGPDDRGTLAEHAAPPGDPCLGPYTDGARHRSCSTGRHS